MSEAVKGQEQKGYVGMDVGKKQIEICRLNGSGKIERTCESTTEDGVQSVIRWLRAGDRVALEAGNQAFRIAKMILSSGHSEVYVLNPGELATIYKSLKKTDKEDALKLARIISWIPAEELPVVPVPSDEIEKCRRILKEEEYWSKQITSGKNKLHSLFVQAGLTEIRKKDLTTSINREQAISGLPKGYQVEANRLSAHMVGMEETLETVKTEIKEILRQDAAYSGIAMSMPGIGLVTTMALYSYIGDGKRFSHGSQVSYYAGLVPRVDISGTIVRYGRITKRGANQLRRTLIQGAWALVRSKHGGAIKEFYERLYPRIGKKKAIVATARKMLEVFYAMITNGSTYNGVPPEEIQLKLHRYGII